MPSGKGRLHSRMVRREETANKRMGLVWSVRRCIRWDEIGQGLREMRARSVEIGTRASQEVSRLDELRIRIFEIGSRSVEIGVGRVRIWAGYVAIGARLLGI